MRSLFVLDSSYESIVLFLCYYVKQMLADKEDCAMIYLTLVVEQLEEYGHEEASGLERDDYYWCSVAADRLHRATGQ